MREGWEMKKLNEVTLFKSGKTVSKDIERTFGDVIYTKVGDMNLIGNEENITTSSRFVDFKDINQNQIIPIGSVIFPKRGGAIATNKKRKIVQPTIVDLNTMAIAPSEKLLSEYLYYWLESIDLNDLSNGTSIPQINNNSFDNVFIHFPKSLEEQKQIVAILDKAFTAIDQAKANIEKNRENAKELFQSKLNDIFSQKGEGWQEKSLGENCNISMGQSPKGTSYNSEGIGMPLINGPVEFGPNPFSKTIMSKWTTEPTKLCEEGDLILCVRGSTTGRINIAGFKACIGRGVASIRYIKNQEWINFFIRCNQNNIYALGTGSTFPNVSGKILSELKFSEPKSIETQNHLIQIMKQLESNINSVIKGYENKIEDLDELKKSMLKKAFAGELTSPERTKYVNVVLPNRNKLKKALKG